jgi:hypothetical protein
VPGLEVGIDWALVGWFKGVGVNVPAGLCAVLPGSGYGVPLEVVEVGSCVPGPGYAVPEDVVEVGVVRPGAGYGPLPAPGGAGVGDRLTRGVWADGLEEGTTATDVPALVADAAGFNGGDVMVTAGVAVERGVDVGSGVLARRQALKSRIKDSMSTRSLRELLGFKFHSSL